MIEQLSIFDLLNPVESRLTFVCRQGSGFENGKIRIYCAAMNMNTKELSGYLREEYGIGGWSADFPDGGRGFADHNGSGIIIREWKAHTSERYSWTQVAKEIKRLIINNDYLTEKEWKKVEAVCNGGPAPVPIPRCAF